jgi:hypothetical protein
MKDERDICVVKCPFSSKTDRIATQRSCALDDTDVAETISLAVWWAGRITKTLLSVLKHPFTGFAGIGVYADTP